MFSRIKYINYPSFARKKMIEKEKKKNKKNRSVIKTILTVILLIFILLAAALTVSWFKGRSAAKSEATLDSDAVVLEDEPAPVITNSGEVITYKGTTYSYNSNIVTFAFIGIDKATMGLDNGIVGTGGQSDTIAILAYDVSTGGSKIIVVPRETMVDVSTFDINGCYLDIKKMQICLAYAYGDGAKTSCENALSSISRLLFGMKINHYIALDLEGLVAVNDAVGGVDVTCLETIGQFKEGERITLLGQMADQYVRDRRKDIVDADTFRRARQKQYIESFVSKTMGLIKKDFTLVPSLWTKASDYMVTDLTVNDATYLASVALSRSFTLGEFKTVPGTYAMGKDFVEYTPDTDALFELILDTFYNK